MEQKLQSKNFVIPTEVEGSLDVARDYKTTKQNGFTLVELAIALMVIGLLIGGVLKGQELIENARVTRVVKDINDYDTAVMIFRNTYNAIPGDMKNAARRLPNCGAPYCSQTHTRNGDGKVNAVPEIRNFWIHLERAGLISGINEQDDRYSASPIHAFGGHFVVTHGTVLRDDPDSAEDTTTPTEAHPIIPNYRVGDSLVGGPSSDRLACRRIQLLDNKMDDGLAYKGRVKTYISGGNSAYTDHTTKEYDPAKASSRQYISVESYTRN